MGGRDAPAALFNPLGVHHTAPILTASAGKSLYPSFLPLQNPLPQPDARHISPALNPFSFPPAKTAPEPRVKECDGNLSTVARMLRVSPPTDLPPEPMQEYFAFAHKRPHISGGSYSRSLRPGLS